MTLLDSLNKVVQVYNTRIKPLVERGDLVGSTFEFKEIHSYLADFREQLSGYSHGTEFFKTLESIGEIVGMKQIVPSREYTKLENDLMQLLSAVQSDVR